MKLFFIYSFKNILNRKLSSSLTILGFALVVFVFCAVMMLSNGLNQTLVDTGSDGNAVVIRQGSQTEVQSIIYPDVANIIKADPAVMTDNDGKPMFTNELMILINQPKRESNEPSNVPVRGVTPMSYEIRPQFTLVEGRMIHEGTSELIAGKKVSETFQGCGIGEKVRFGMREWTVVGIFEADGAGFESELWGDVNQLKDAFNRPIFSSLTFKMNPNINFDELKKRIENDPKLEVEIDKEKEYYAKQSSITRSFIEILGYVVSIIFSMGAIVGAMITMYASVANRTVEIGTLRSLGFRRFVIWIAFLFEALLISLIGASIGIALATLLRYIEVSTTNWDTFAELAFSFETSGDIILNAYIFAVIMGIIGGFIPAVSASRLKIIDALRSK